MVKIDKDDWIKQEDRFVKLKKKGAVITQDPVGHVQIIEKPYDWECEERD